MDDIFDPTLLMEGLEVVVAIIERGIPLVWVPSLVLPCPFDEPHNVFPNINCREIFVPTVEYIGSHSAWGSGRPPTMGHPLGPHVFRRFPSLATVPRQMPHSVAKRDCRNLPMTCGRENGSDLERYVNVQRLYDSGLFLRKQVI